MKHKLKVKEVTLSGDDYEKLVDTITRLENQVVEGQGNSKAELLLRKMTAAGLEIHDSAMEARDVQIVYIPPGAADKTLKLIVRGR